MDLPGSDELEVSVFGPGVGECVVIHLGSGDWMVVDSCNRQHDRKPAALEYLRELGVDLALQVRLVLVTHWHDDHTRGVGELFRWCSSAELACSAALRSNELLTLHLGTSYDSGVAEFGELLKELEARRAQGMRREACGPKWAIADRPLLDRPASASCPGYEVWALSPSDASVSLAMQEIAACLPPASVATRGPGPPKRRAVARRPNHAAVVLRVRVGQVEVLLGSDLEVTPDPSTGWNAVLTCRQATGRAAVLKVAHHGSENGHEPRVWANLLLEPVHAVLTPFLAGKKPLPSQADVARLRAQTSNLYITSSARWVKPPKRDAAVERTLVGIGSNRRALREEFGQVRLRASASDAASMRVDLFGTAHQI